MGFFSWKTSDTNESIPNIYCENAKTFPVLMLDDKGNTWREAAYDGYGVFGGMSYIDLYLAMNDGNDAGLWRHDPHARRPKFIRDIYLPEQRPAWDDLPDSPDCPGQGYWLTSDGQRSPEHQRILDALAERVHN